VVSIIPQPLYPLKGTQIPIKKGLGGPHSQAGSVGEEKTSIFIVSLSTTPVADIWLCRKPLWLLWKKELTPVSRLARTVSVMYDGKVWNN
jgi:hypothetical protein